MNKFLASLVTPCALKNFSCEYETVYLFWLSFITLVVLVRFHQLPHIKGEVRKTRAYIAKAIQLECSPLVSLSRTRSRWWYSTHQDECRSSDTTCWCLPALQAKTTDLTLAWYPDFTPNVKWLAFSACSKHYTAISIDKYTEHGGG